MEFLTIKEHRYAGKLRGIGEKYTIAGKSDARLVKALGWAIEESEKVVSAVVAKPKPVTPEVIAVDPIVLQPIAEFIAETVISDSVEPEPESIAPVEETESSADEATRTKRKYTRRDLSAE